MTTQNQRRLIFLGLLLVIVLPQLMPGLFSQAKGVTPSPQARGLYEAVEKLPAGSPLLISFDFELGSKLELEPAARALLRQAFRKKLRIVAMNLWVNGQGLAAQIVREEAASFYGSVEMAQERYGKDYVYLGWSPGLQAVIIQMGESITRTYPKEYQGAATEGLEVLRGVRELNDFPLVVSISAGSPGIEEWLQYGQGKYNIRMATSVTAVAAPSLLRFFKSGQLVGLLGGMRGAYEYELLIGVPGFAKLGMNTLSAAHFYIITLILGSNVVYFWNRRQSRR